jgi:hypothetical protein
LDPSLKERRNQFLAKASPRQTDVASSEIAVRRSHSRTISASVDTGMDVRLAAAIMAMFFLTLIYELSRNWQYILWLTQLGSVKFQYHFVRVGGVQHAFLATLQMLVLGSVIVAAIVPAESNLLFRRVASLGFGVGFVGLFGTILADVNLFFFWSIEVLILGAISGIFVVQMIRLRHDFPPWVKKWLFIWRPSSLRLSGSEIAVAVVVSAFAVLSYYDAIMYPISEWDSLIYHASAAAIVYYNHGMPLIDGGGVGLGISANYPLLFSYVGTYYYVFVGRVEDVWLRILAPSMWLLSVLTTYLVGSTLGRKKVGLIAAFLIAMVPAYYSYAFQASDEDTVTFFIALGFLFLVLALGESKRGYFVGCGLSFGAACLTTYQALYFLVPLFLVIGWHSLRRGARRGISGITLVLLPLIGVGAAPYVRNAVVLHDPVFPFFTWLFPASSVSGPLMRVTFESLMNSAFLLVDPSESPTLYGFLRNLLTYPTLYPLNLTLVVPGLLIMTVVSCLRYRSHLALFLVIPSTLILGLSAPFVRYFWLTLPFAAIIVSAAFVSAGHSLSAFAPPRGLISVIVRSALPLMLTTLLVFPVISGVGLVQDYAFLSPIPNSQQDFFRYFSNPGMNVSQMAPQIYSSDAEAWFWLSQNASTGRVAVFEPRVYYINFSLQTPQRMLYLDSSYALPLYQLETPGEILSFLKAHDVRYIFITYEDWNSEQFRFMPFSFSKMLGSPLFPLLYKNGMSEVFAVGQIQNPVLESEVPAYSFALSSPAPAEGRLAENVPVGSDSPRLYIETENALTELKMTYLDSGVGSLEVNLYNPAQGGWIYDYANITKQNTGRWLNMEMLVPMNYVNNYTVFGLHAFGSTFSISQLKITKVQEEGRASYEFLYSPKVTALTSPSSLMIYLPIMNKNDRLLVSTITNGLNCSIGVFQGYIPLNQTTNWWLSYRNVASSTQLSAENGVVNPALSWMTPTTGVYTLVLVSCNAHFSPSRVSVSISLVSSTFSSQLPPP